MLLFRSSIVTIIIILVVNQFTTGQSNSDRPSNQITSPWFDKFDANSLQSEHPEPQFMRSGKWFSLNGKWEYSVTKSYEESFPAFKDTIVVPYPIESMLSGVGRKLNPDEILWYRMKQRIGKVNGRILLHFGAVDYSCTLYINRKFVGTHIGGYTSFAFDITDFIDRKENEIILKVIDKTENGIGPHGKQSLNPKNIYYTACSGIWQTVWIEYVQANYLKNVSYDYNINDSILNIKVNKVAARKNGPGNFLIKAYLYEKDSLVMGSIGLKDSLISFKLKHPNLWSPDKPTLYTLVFELWSNNKLCDKVKSYYGLRSVKIGKDEKGYNRILLNNKFVYNLGVLDQGYWPEGNYAAPSDDALKFDIYQIKRLGFNTIRKHIKIEPARWYYYADSIGILVWQDFVNPNQSLPKGAKTRYEIELKETIDQLRNHPSITTWVVFNERWGAYDQGRIAKWVKFYDPSRIVNAHSGEYLYVNDKLRKKSDTPYVSSDIVDFHSYPGPKMPFSIENKATAIGEYGGLGVSVPNHQWMGSETPWGYSGILTTGKMIQQYEIMIDTLLSYKERGLSASIYTQPYDVESEQNGLLTYDRKVIKVPPSKIYELNNKLVLSNTKIKEYKWNPIVFESRSVDYIELTKRLNTDKLDSAELRRLYWEALTRSDSVTKNLCLDKYLSTIHDRTSFNNVQLIVNCIGGESEIGFKYTLQNYEKLRRSKIGEECIMKARQIIKMKLSTMLEAKASKNPMNIHEMAVNVFGKISEPVAWDIIAFEFFKAQDFENWFKYKRAISDNYPFYTGIYDLNNDAWKVFSYSFDRDKLSTALEWSKRVIEEEPTGNHYDTYANIIYKLGRKGEAIKIQKAALSLSIGDGDREEMITNLKRMEKDEPTWK